MLLQFMVDNFKSFKHAAVLSMEILFDVKKYVKGYKKETTEMYELTKENIEMAICNAKKLEIA